MKIESPAFQEGEKLPQKFTCDGLEISPTLNFIDIPDNATSLALVVDDPDAPGTEPWTHWLVWNIDPGTSGIDEDEVPLGAIEGTATNGEMGYNGPCPPSGRHRYYFRLFAIDKEIKLGPEASRSEFEDAIDGHIADEATLMATYERAQ